MMNAVCEQILNNKKLNYTFCRERGVSTKREHKAWAQKGSTKCAPSKVGAQSRSTKCDQKLGAQCKYQMWAWCV